MHVYEVILDRGQLAREDPVTEATTSFGLYRDREDAVDRAREEATLADDIDGSGVSGKVSRVRRREVK